MGGGSAGAVLQSSRLRQLWQKHKVRIVVLALLAYFICFTSYDVYFTTKKQQEAQLQAADADPSDYSEQTGNTKQIRTMYETDPDLIWDDRAERQRQTEE
mmetsp:Transcript_21716/g.29136  ORF Transcript_21716/g.29136 Transcript_21716/m.29136 type:complete len:100 (-) Transcript_21716:1360-1659(-)